MPLTVPAFSQYQSPIVPLRGLWNSKPIEGDKFCNVEIDWITSTGGYQAQQFQLSAGPVQLSQIVALFVDNSRSGADVSFIFPDSGFELVTPAHNQVLTPVLTNALSFYASAPKAIAGDVTVLQIMNSMPPPIPIAPSFAQNSNALTGLGIASGSTQLVPLGVSGTLNTISLSIELAAGTGSLQLALQDGTGRSVWANYYAQGTTVNNIAVDLTGLNVRFTNGLTLYQSIAGGCTGSINVNVYYSTP